MLTAVILTVLVSMVLIIIRLISGPSTYDRILAANTFGTKVVILIVIMSFLIDDAMLLDIAFIYVLINFVTTIGFLKYFKYNSLGKE